MNARISENTLFAVLIAAFVGWTAVSVATDRTAPSSASSEVAQVAAAGSHS